MARTHYRDRQMRVYLASEHDFRLRLGGGVVGPAVRMLGREAHERNQVLEREYVAGRARRLARWERC